MPVVRTPKKNTPSSSRFFVATACHCQSANFSVAACLIVHKSRRISPRLLSEIRSAILFSCLCHRCNLLTCVQHFDTVPLGFWFFENSKKLFSKIVIIRPRKSNIICVYSDLHVHSTLADKQRTSGGQPPDIDSRISGMAPNFGIFKGYANHRSYL